jgi:hypothetical protein
LLFINNQSLGYSPEFSEIEDLVKQDYMLQEQDKKLNDYLDSVKAEYRVIINPTYEF